MAKKRMLMNSIPIYLAFRMYIWCIDVRFFGCFVCNLIDNVTNPRIAANTILTPYCFNISRSLAKNYYDCNSNSLINKHMTKLSQQIIIFDIYNTSQKCYSIIKLHFLYHFFTVIVLANLIRNFSFFNFCDVLNMISLHNFTICNCHI